MSASEPPPTGLADVTKAVGATAQAQYEIKSPEDPDEAAHRRHMERLNWWAGTILASGVAAGALLVGALTIFYGASDDVRKVGANIIVPVVAAVLGYVAGRMGRK